LPDANLFMLKIGRAFALLVLVANVESRPFASLGAGTTVSTIRHAKGRVSTSTEPVEFNIEAV
jgi:hypothetical protein